MCTFTQGWLCLVEVILVVTSLVMMPLRSVLRYWHISSTGDSAVNMPSIDDDDSLVAAGEISLMLALDQRRIFLLTGLVRVTLAVASMRSAAWSLTPATSSIRFTRDGLFVKTRSRQFFLMSICVDYMV